MIKKCTGCGYLSYVSQYQHINIIVQHKLLGRRVQYEIYKLLAINFLCKIGDNIFLAPGSSRDVACNVSTRFTLDYVG